MCVVPPNQIERVRHRSAQVSLTNDDVNHCQREGQLLTFQRHGGTGTPVPRRRTCPPSVRISNRLWRFELKVTSRKTDCRATAKPGLNQVTGHGFSFFYMPNRFGGKHPTTSSAERTPDRHYLGFVGQVAVKSRLLMAIWPTILR